MTFDFAPSLRGQTLHLDPLREADREDLYQAASDPLIWALHPATMRHRRDVFDPYLDGLLATPGSLTVREAATGRIIGTSRFYVTPDIAGSMAIGYTFLVRDHWGGASNREIKTLMIAHVFASFPEVWLHIDLENLRSQRAALKIGARFVDERDVDVSGTVAPRKRYVLARENWGNIIP